MLKETAFRGHEGDCRPLPPRPKKRSGVPLLLALCWLGAATGCGGDEPATVKRSRSERRPSRVETGQAPTQDDGDRQQTQQSTSVPPTAGLGELFQIAEERRPNFQVVGRDAAGDADRFAAVFPQEGTDSSTFRIRQRGTDPDALPQGDLDPEFELPDGFTALAEQGYSAQGQPWRIRCEADGAVMALVPAGEFVFGTDQGTSQTGPAHTFHLDAFYLDTTEVTLGQFLQYREAALAGEDRIPEEPLNANAPSDHPVLGTTWGEARGYAQWAGKDLPSEAEWEKAARGPNGFRFPWGNGRAVWSRKRELGQIDAVGAFPLDRSYYGILDTAGNAAEWCVDWYSDQTHERVIEALPKFTRNWQGPRRPSRDNQRVIKGAGPDWSLWNRRGAQMNERMPDVGFRCVLRLESD